MNNITVFLDTFIDPVIEIHIIDTDSYCLNKHLKIDFVVWINYNWNQWQLKTCWWIKYSLLDTTQQYTKWVLYSIVDDSA